MKKALILTLSALLALAQMGNAQSKMDLSEGRDRCANWADKTFSKGKTPPFSFKYDGVPSETFLKKCKFTRSIEPEEGYDVKTYSWTDRKSGLQVEAKVKVFKGFDALEWTLWFTNTGKTDSGQISDVKVADINAAATKKGPWKVFYSKGSCGAINDFMAMTKEFSQEDTLCVIPAGGRSSSVEFPYFNAKTPEGGLIVAVGWSGSWKAQFTRPSENAFRIEAGQREIDTFLYPGESMRTPLVAIMPWEGEDRMDGQNSFRRFMLAFHHPRDSHGEIIQAPICSGFNYGDSYPCNEYTCMTAEYAIALVHRYQQFNILPEVFWLDAGWFEKADNWKEGWNWANAVGNWTPDKERFPQGMGPIGDACHEVGSKFMVWFEPERVIKDSDWAYAHPEFLLQAGGGKVEPHPIDRSFPDSYLFDLGNDEGRKWFIGEIIKLLKDNKIDYYRQDYNIDPEYFWSSNDEPGRKGMKEIRYICGLYAFWDALREEFPDMLIDNCASGGRRLDLEASSRSIALWRTDYTYGEPYGYESQTYGLSQWLPASGTGIHYSDAFCSRSGYNNGAIFNWSVTSHTSNVFDMQKRMAELQSIRSYYLEDYYPLTGYEDNTGSDQFIAYQLNKPSDSTGRVLGFRRDACPKTQIEVRLRGLDPDKTYIVENQDSFERVEMTGRQLSEKLVLALPEPRTSIYLKYWEKHDNP